MRATCVLALRFCIGATLWRFEGLQKPLLDSIEFTRCRSTELATCDFIKELAQSDYSDLCKSL